MSIVVFFHFEKMINNQNLNRANYHIDFGRFKTIQFGWNSLFDLILYVHSTIFQLCGTVLPGFNQY